MPTDMNGAEMKYEYDQAAEQLEAAARAYNEAIDRAIREAQEQQNANGQGS